MEKLVPFCDYFFSFIIEKLFIPGKIETWIMIVDLNNVGATSIPIKNVKSIISHGNKFFRGRMHK